MDGITYNIDEEMKANAYHAIKEANERFGQNLDYSDDSIALFENLLNQEYQSLSLLSDVEGSSGKLSQTADIWGSYLGEYMCLKWGGKWMLHGSNRLVFISNILFSPIHFVYQKLTSHPEYSVEIYLNEMKRIIYTSVINPKQVQNLSENIGQPKKVIPAKKLKLPVTIDKHLLFILAGIGGVVLVVVASIFGYRYFKTGGISAPGLIASATSENTEVPVVPTLVTATAYSTITPFPTPTILPTYTPKPTITPRPSRTPFLTYTQKATSTPAITQTPFVPTRTSIPRRSPTSIPDNPTSTPQPPIQPPTPTATQPAPVIIESCEIDPSIVPVGFNVTITFIVHFSSQTPGYGFVAENVPVYAGQSGCTGTDTDGDGVAFCDGSSGQLPSSTTIYVTLSSSVGNCEVSYSSR